MFDVYDKLPICHNIKDSKVRTKDVILDEEVKFSSLLLEEHIQQGLAKCGYCLLSPIQKNALPLALTGTSIIAHAKSGTGKTLIYLLTALNLYVKSKPRELFCLILTPTREIAKQVYDVCKNVACFIEGLKIEFFIGGIPIDLDVIKCKTCHIAVGAPGRIKHLVDLAELKVQNVRLLVLDEVDALVNNKEFALKDLVATLPTSRQTIVCTATYAENIGELLKPISSDLKYVNMYEKESQLSTSLTSNVLIGVKQYVAPVFSDSSPMDTIRRRNKLLDILKYMKYDQCFIFVNYLSVVRSVHNFLVNSNFDATWISSEQNQSSRMGTLDKIKFNECKILVTTDLASRGIDVHNANLVINLGVPTPPDTYVHRLGRAGRFGSEGAVVTIVLEGEELELFKHLVNYVISEPVNLYLMPREISPESLSCPLQFIRCEPQPDSPVMSDFMAKYKSKVQCNTQTTSKKKKNRKTNPKRNMIRHLMTQGHVFHSEFYESSSDSDPKSMPVELAALKKLLEEYKVILQNEMSRRMCIDTNALTQLINVKKSGLSGLVFDDYFSEEKEEERREVCEDDAHVEQACINLSEFVRKKNAFLDEQKIPCTVTQFFKLQNLNNATEKDETNTMQKLINDVLEKLQGLLAKPIDSQDTCSTTDESILPMPRKVTSPCPNIYNVPKQVSTISTANGLQCVVDSTPFVKRHTLQKNAQVSAAEQFMARPSQLGRNTSQVNTLRINDGMVSSNITGQATTQPSRVEPNAAPFPAQYGAFESHSIPNAQQPDQAKCVAAYAEALAPMPINTGRYTTAPSDYHQYFHPCTQNANLVSMPVDVTGQPANTHMPYRLRSSVNAHAVSKPDNVSGYPPNAEMLHQPCFSFDNGNPLSIVKVAEYLAGIQRDDQSHLQNSNPAMTDNLAASYVHPIGNERTSEIPKNTAFGPVRRPHYSRMLAANIELLNEQMRQENEYVQMQFTNQPTWRVPRQTDLHYPHLNEDTRDSGYNIDDVDESFMLASLTSFVSPENERRIYRSHFNFIASSLEKIHKSYLHN